MWRWPSAATLKLAPETEPSGVLHNPVPPAMAPPSVNVTGGGSGTEYVPAAFFGGIPGWMTTPAHLRHLVSPHPTHLILL